MLQTEAKEIKKNERLVKIERDKERGRERE